MGRRKKKWKNKHKKRSNKNKKQRKISSAKTKAEGVIQFTYSGDAFVRNLEGEDFFVPRFCINGALHADEVEVEILQHTPKTGKLKEACVIRIVKRAKDKFVGLVDADMKGLFFRPDNNKLPRMLFKDPTNLEVGSKVLVKLHSWSDEHLMHIVDVVEVLGKAGDDETEKKAILYEYNFNYNFPPEVEKYAQELKEKFSNNFDDYKLREDFRNRITFTIDPDDAKDFDDAISVKELDDGYEIGVHIADVTHYVHFNDPIDKEAQKRGTSVYLVDETIPMLPEVLSNDLCSLNPNEDKRTFSVIFLFDKALNIKNYRFAKTIINSNKRFTYKEAQKVLDLKEGEFLKELQILQRIASKLRQEREKEGSLEFDTPELEFKLDEDGVPVEVRVKDRLETMKMIEDLMLAANKAVANYMQDKLESKKQGAFIFRVHDVPDPEKIEELAIFLRALGYELEHDSGKVGLKELSSMLKNIKNSAMQATIEKATLRSMAKAVYSHKNIGHFSLGFDNYTHFTSPIRRYPDIMVHRILYATLKGEELPKSEIEAYKVLAVESSLREIDAQRAERDSVRIKQLEYMQKFIGQEFTVYVSGIIKSGIFLAEEKTLSEGFAYFSSFKEFFEYDESCMCAKSPSGKTIHIGDKLKAKLLKVDLRDKSLEWSVDL